MKLHIEYRDKNLQVKREYKIDVVGIFNYIHPYKLKEFMC